MKNNLLSLLAIFGVFASGFLMRPIGGVIFGHIGDRYGRKEALSLTIIFMVIPTVAIGLLPVFNTVGVIAPILLVFLRLIQGAASSGEYPGAICFLAEIAPVKKRGLWASLSMFGVVGGVLLGTIINLALSSLLSVEQINDWGWRIPFLIGFPLGIIGWFLRCKINESEIFNEIKLAQKTVSFPLGHVIRCNGIGLRKITILFSAATVAFYINFVYVMSYLVSTHKASFHQILINNILGISTLILLIPVFGYLSDKINRKYIMFAGVFCLSFFSYPVFNLFLEYNFYKLWLGQILSALFLAMLVGPLAAMAPEVFATCNRYSGVSISLNIGASIFGGTCPLIVTFLVYYFGKESIPSVYLIFFSILCLYGLIGLKKDLNFLPQ